MSKALLLSTRNRMLQEINEWVDKLGAKDILSLAPHGFMLGCGETSEYLAYALRMRPQTIEDLFAINRTSSYFDSSSDRMEFSSGEVTLALDEVEARLKSRGYVRLSFHDGKEEDGGEDATPEEITESVRKIIFQKPPPTLFDHSCVLLLYKGSIWRWDSYIDQYSPQATEWPTYKEDITRLFRSPSKTWQEIFGVTCHPHYDMDRVTIHLAN